MSIVETTLAITIAQIPTYFIQRYIFKGIVDRHLDKIEEKAKNLLKSRIKEQNGHT